MAELQPREKFYQRGAECMSDVELLTIMIATGTAGMSARKIAENLLEEASGSLRRVLGMTPQEMCQVKGIGMTKAVEIAASAELFRRAQNEVDARPYVYSAADVYDIMRADIGMIPHEELWVLYVGGNKRLLGRRRISQGGLNATQADRRIIFRHAYAMGATEIYLCHNHPSGALTVSDSDMEMTRAIAKACVILGFHLCDHVIVGSTDYLSMMDRGFI